MEIYGAAVEDDLDELEWPITELSCSAPFCQEPIPYVEDLYVITMYSAGYTDQGLQYLPASADDGDYLYEPCYFCKDCWEEVLEELHEHTRDVPPVADEESFCKCNVCESGIRTGELFGISVFGQLQISQRSPDGCPTPTFQAINSKPTVICIACMNILERDIAEMWGGRITQYEECEEGTFMRCWRLGICNCDGNCAYSHPNEKG